MKIEYIIDSQYFKIIRESISSGLSNCSRKEETKEPLRVF
jgi:hypothetical protein